MELSIVWHLDSRSKVQFLDVAVLFNSKSMSINFINSFWTSQTVKCQIHRKMSPSPRTCRHVPLNRILKLFFVLLLFFYTKSLRLIPLLQHLHVAFQAHTRQVPCISFKFLSNLVAYRIFFPHPISPHAEPNSCSFKSLSEINFWIKSLLPPPFLSTTANNTLK